MDMDLWKAFRSDWNEPNKRIEFRIGKGRRVCRMTDGGVRVP